MRVEDRGMHTRASAHVLAGAWEARRQAWVSSSETSASSFEKEFPIDLELID